MSVRTKYFFIIRCTWTTNLEAWAPQQEYLGVRNPRNFYLGDQLWGLGTLAKMLGSLRGSLKFSLEHSLAKWDPEVLKGAFRSSKNSHCQNETKSKTFVVKMSSISMRKKIIFISMALQMVAWCNSKMAIACSIKRSHFI